MRSKKCSPVGNFDNINDLSLRNYKFYNKINESFFNTFTFIKIKLYQN